MTDLPEGVEISVSVYYTSPETGIDMAIKIGNFATVPDFEAIGKHGGKLPLLDTVNDWRRMTREEIAEYKKDCDDDASP